MKRADSTLNQKMNDGNFLTGGTSDESLLRRLLRSPDLRRVLPGLGISSFLINILSLALPLAILQILDRVVANQSFETLAFLVIGVIIALLLEEVLRAINGVVTSWLGVRFEHSTSIAALERLMSVPLQIYQKEEASVHKERILATVKVSEFYSGQMLQVLFDLPFVVIYPLLIYFIGGWLFLVPVLLFLLFSFLIYHFGNWMREQVRLRTIQDDRRIGFLTEVLSGIFSVKTMMMESLMLRRYERLQETNSVLGDALIRGNTLASNMGMLFSQVMIVAVVFASSWLVIQGKMTPGGLSACMMLSVRALQPLRRGLSMWMRYQAIIAALAKLNQVFVMPYDKDEGKPEMPPMAKELELRDITLKFKGADARDLQSLAKSALHSGTLNKNEEKNSSGGTSREEFFSHISIKLQAGQIIAIHGASGSGKTNLLSLMNGMLRPTSGEVLVDGAPLQSYTTGSVYRGIAMLPQVGTIVSGTILENITMFDPTLQDEALRISAKLGLDQIVSGLKLGYETPVGQGVAETLPVGLRQVIAIIRALVRKPSVILFDEANISLDMRMDKLLINYLAALKGECSIVLVTHRPSMLKLADIVYSLIDGRLQEGIIDPGAGAATVALKDISNLPDRPESDRDLSAVIRRQFDEESDLSICLLPLLKALEWQGKPRQLADAMPHLARLMDVTVLCSIMANLEHFPKHLSCHLASLDVRLMPCLFIPPDKPAILLLDQLPNGNFRVFDSALLAERELAPGEDAGEIFLFKKTDDLRHSRRPESSWINGILLRFQSHILMAFVLTIAGALLALAPPLFVRTTLDRILPSGDIVMGTFILMGVAVAIAVDSLLRILKGKIMGFIGGRFEYILGNTLFKRIINLPASSTDNATISNQVGRFKTLESLRDFFLGPISLLIFEFPSTLLLLLAIAVINPWVLLVMLTSIVLFANIWFFTRKPVESSTAKSGMLSTARWEFLSETLTEMSSIRSVGADQSWADRFRELSGKSIMANFKNNLLQARINGVAQFLTSATGLMALALSAYLVIHGNITSGTMVATMMILWRVNGPLQNIFLAITAVTQSYSTVRQVENLLRIKSESESGAPQSIPPVAGGALSFARVSFRYANDADPVLLGVSFSVTPGQIIVIAGQNGSGKSTVLKLIERIYVPQAGTIRMNNIDVRQLSVSDLRARISYMPQRCELFYGTVAQNLRLSYPTASDAELDWAVQMAGLDEDIAALHQGFNTRISSSQLSNGFSQRLSLARAMLKPADIVLLDEPGTGMDQHGEEALVRCIEWFRKRTTVIMVSHRPGHMRLADNVVLMQRGTVIAMGPFDKIKDKVMSELS